MEHFYQNIHGWFNYERLYTEMVNKFGDGSHFVEVGSWVGRSACYLGVAIFNSGKNIKLDCVDTWLGDVPELQEEDVVKNGTLYTDFLRNIEPIKNIITPVRLTSIEASKLYDDESLDFVFIDANHSPEHIEADTNNWYPKVKKGGVFAGHDYDYPHIGERIRSFFDGGRYEVLTPNTWVHYKQ